MQKTAKSYKNHWHCVFQLKYHLVLVTKYRKPCFTAEILKRLEQICHEQCKKWAIELIEFGGEDDHIHLLLDMHPNIMPSISTQTLSRSGWRIPLTLRNG